jgi:hypothetical protein
MERNGRKNKEGESQRTPRSRSNGFPHLEERLIGRIVNIDLLSLFSLKNMQESWEGWVIRLKRIYNF